MCLMSWAGRQVLYVTSVKALTSLSPASCWYQRMNIPSLAPACEQSGDRHYAHHLLERIWARN